MAQNSQANSFAEDLFPKELEEIYRRRKALDGHTVPDTEIEVPPSIEQDLVGLAFSGGGIRSSSFSLGVAQYLIRSGLFKHVDYLSTVSGGGYTGACLSSLMHQMKDGEELLVQRDGTEEPPALNHIRNGSNFLLPAGLLNRLRMPSLFIVGVLQTLLLFIPVIVFFVFLTELFFEVTGRLAIPVPAYLLATLGCIPLLITVFLRPIRHSRRLTWEQRDRADRRAGASLVLAVGSLVITPILAGIDFLVDSDVSTVVQTLQDWTEWHFDLGVRSWLLWLSLLILLFLILSFIRHRNRAVLWMAGIFGPLFLLGLYLLGCLYVINSPDVIPSMAVDYSEALEEYASTEDTRRLEEAVSRILIEKQFNPSDYRIDFRSIDKANLSKTRLRVYRRENAKKPWWRENEWLFFLTTRDQDQLTIRYHRFREGLVLIPELSLLQLRTEWGFYLAGLLLWLYNYLFINVNRISLHPFYRDRLSRTFLLQPGSDGVESADSLRLSELSSPGTSAPYHLINTALNLQGINDPQLRQRKTVPFVLSKRFCGSEYTGYCHTESMEQLDSNLDLGTAMSVSAAAGGPMMGVHTVRSLTFILTLLNVRLGYWLPHPQRVGRTTWLDRLARRNPGLTCLLSEAFGVVSDRGRFINCSDGAHIENLGVYELLRRRCKVIICVAAGADPDFEFFDLTTLQRFANIDLDARIDLDLSPLLPDDNGISKEHSAVGRVIYHNGEEGIFIYLKLSYSGDEPEYVRFYKSKVPKFPHEPTSDQFFNETKFEVYRALGHHVAEKVFDEQQYRNYLQS